MGLEPECELPRTDHLEEDRYLQYLLAGELPPSPGGAEYNPEPSEQAAEVARTLQRRVKLIYLYGVFALYTICRLCVITVAFTSLRSMPNGVYETTWANFIPHFG